MWQHFKPIVGCFKSLLSHRDSEGGEHAQELSFCIVVPDSARKGHRETRGNSSEKIQRSRDSPCTWWDNTFTYLNIQLHIDIQNYMLNTLLYICQVNDHFRSTGCWSSWRLDLSRISSFCWSISDVRNSTWSSSRSQGEHCNLLGWIATFANVSPDLLVNLHFFWEAQLASELRTMGFAQSAIQEAWENFFQQKNQLQNWLGLLVARP